MSNNIILDKELGINCRMTICPRCGGDGGALAILGNKNYVATCTVCKAQVFGTSRRHKDKCPKCPNREFTTRRLYDYEKIPVICGACEDELATFDKIIKEGGLPFKCSECGCSGVLRKSDFTDNFRKMAFDAGHINDITDVVGVNFTACVEHAGDKGAKNE